MSSNEEEKSLEDSLEDVKFILGDVDWVQTLKGEGETYRTDAIIAEHGEEELRRAVQGEYGLNRSGEPEENDELDECNEALNELGINRGGVEEAIEYAEEIKEGEKPENEVNDY